MELYARFHVAPLLWLLIVASVSGGAGAEEPAPRELRHLGGATAVTRVPLVTARDLRKLFRDRRADFAALLEEARWEGRPADLFREIEEGRVSERAFPVGGRLRWMALSGRAGLDLVRDALWAGKEPFEAFEIRFESNDSRWVFLVPKECGNLALFARTGTGEIAVSLASGELRLTDPEGEETVVRGGESATFTARTAPLEGSSGEPRTGEAGVETSFAVEEGELEFSDYGHPISVVLQEGDRVTASITPEGQLAFAVPANNPGPIPIQVGDARGTLSAGSALRSDWELPPFAVLSPASFRAEWAPAAVEEARRISASGVGVVIAPGWSEAGVTVFWETTREIADVRFNLYRERGDDEEPVKVNARAIAARAREVDGAASYRYEDRPLGPGSYRYRLESVDGEGHAQRHEEIAGIEVE